MLSNRWSSPDRHRDGVNWPFHRCYCNCKPRQPAWVCSCITLRVQKPRPQMPALTKKSDMGNSRKPRKPTNGAEKYTVSKPAGAGKKGAQEAKFCAARRKVGGRTTRARARSHFLSCKRFAHKYPRKVEELLVRAGGRAAGVGAAPGHDHDKSSTSRALADRPR